MNEEIVSDHSDELMVINMASMDRYIESAYDFMCQQAIMPYVQLRYLKQGCGATTYLMNRVLARKDAVLIFENNTELKAVSSQYDEKKTKNKLCHLGEMGMFLRGRNISEIYFDNITRDVMSPEIALIYLSSLRKKDSLILDLRTVPY